MLIFRCNSKLHSVELKTGLMTSIVVTLLPMPAALLRSPSQWTVEIHGNISITIGLFIVRYVPPLYSQVKDADRCRSLWFLGIGRVKPATPDKVEKVEQGPPLPAGIATGWYYIFAVIEPVHLALLQLLEKGTDE
jgi:hypothetical protein